MFFIAIQDIKCLTEGMLGEESFGAGDNNITRRNTRVSGGFGYFMFEDAINTTEKGFVNHSRLVVLVPLFWGGVGG